MWGWCQCHRVVGRKGIKLLTSTILWMHTRPSGIEKLVHIIIFLDLPKLYIARMLKSSSVFWNKRRTKLQGMHQLGYFLNKYAQEWMGHLSCLSWKYIVCFYVFLKTKLTNPFFFGAQLSFFFKVQSLKSTCFFLFLIIFISRKWKTEN